MQRLDLVFILILYLMTSSCAVIKDATHEQLIPITSDNVKVLNGDFLEYPAVSVGVLERDMSATKYSPISLWSLINGETVQSDTKTKNIVTIEFVSKRMAVATLWEKGESKKRKIISGKLKNGYFYRRPYFIAIPLVPILFGYSTWRYRIGLIQDSIVVDYRWNRWGYLLFGGGNYSKGFSSTTYCRK